MFQPTIVSTHSIRDFFHDSITAALEQEAINPNEATANYLVELLCDFVNVQDDRLDQPLATVLAKAQTGSYSQSFVHLKQVGDQSLYVCGFFAESLRRNHIDQSYYTILGEVAYNRLSQMLRVKGESTRLVIVFNELGNEFSSFVHVLNHVKQQSETYTTEIAQIYDEWLRTGNSTLEQRLRAAGIVVLKPPPLKI